MGAYFWRTRGEKQTVVKMTAFGSGQTQIDVLEMVRNAVISGADLKARALAERIVQDSERDVIASLSEAWVIDRFMSLIYAERARQHRSAQMRLPGFDELPLRITGKRGHRCDLDKATYTDLREYRKWLGARNRKRYRNDPRLRQVTMLMKMVKKYSGTTRRITVGEVFLREQAQTDAR